MNPWNETIYRVSDQFDSAEPRTMTETRKHTKTLNMIFNAQHKETKRPSDINSTKEGETKENLGSKILTLNQKAEALKGQEQN